MYRTNNYERATDIIGNLNKGPTHKIKVINSDIIKGYKLPKTNLELENDGSCFGCIIAGG